MKTCKRCSKPIPARRLSFRALYCSRECKSEVSNEAYRALNTRSGLSSGTVGAISELEVAADLLKQGYEVFRSVSQSCSCDLAVLRNGKLLRVEVRTGWFAAGGRLVGNATTKDRERFDVLATVSPAKDRRIEYEPSLESFGV